MHHQLHHDGVICITGTGGAIRVTHADGRPYGTPPPPAPQTPKVENEAPPRSPARTTTGDATSTVVGEATTALVGLGFRRGEAAAFVARAAAHVGGSGSLEQTVTAALREAGRART